MKAFALAVGVALALVPYALGRHDPKPALTLVDRTPVVVRGTGFGARERVVVTAAAGTLTEMQRAKATRLGTFRIVFEGLRLTPCSGATFVATGARGHVARLKLALRECPEPILEP